MIRSGLFLVALAATPAAACDLPGGPAEKLESTTRTILYRPAPALRIGEHFALELAVCPPPQQLKVDAWMPEHRHGMNYQPSIKHLGGERYRAEGLLFHMPGRWEFVFELRAGGKTERLVHAIQVE